MEAADDVAPVLTDKGQPETVPVNRATNASDAIDGTGLIRLKAPPEILAHDDGAGVRGTLSQQLRHEGFAVRVAADAAEALARRRRWRASMPGRRSTS